VNKGGKLLEGSARVLILSVPVKKGKYFYRESPVNVRRRMKKEEKEGEENYPRAWKQWVARYLNRPNSGAI
jgi:hypothetical protein